MSLAPNELRDRFRAAVLGFAVGDALGFPLRGVPPEGLAQLPSLTEDYVPRPRGRFSKGQFSDDTQVLLAVAESLAQEKRVDGKSAAAHVAWLWEEGVVLQPPQCLSEAAGRLLRGTPWMSAGAPLGDKHPAVLSRGVPLGLWAAAWPERLGHDATVLAVFSHKDPACAAGVAAVARAVSLGLSGEALSPSRFCEEVARAASSCDERVAEELFHLPRTLSWSVDRALAQLRVVGVAPGALEGVEGLPSQVLPVLLVGLFAALRVPHDVREALGLVLRCGGEADVAAGLCGAVLGAQLGSEAIPPRLRKNVLYAEHLEAAADRLFEARHAERAVVDAPALARVRRS